MMNGIPPYKMLKAWDVREIKNGKAKLSMMRKVTLSIHKEARIVNRADLIKPKMSEREAMDLYHAVKHLFHFPVFETKVWRYQTLS